MKTVTMVIKVVHEKSNNGDILYTIKQTLYVLVLSVNRY